MSGVPMFSCSANIEVEPSLSMVVVDEQLSEIADELAIDILLEETLPE
jgi:glycine cleavage system regulatory protein